ncbi:DUF2782 domain-containing protein [Ferrigenium sp. UT5]|uniref:DUF2782 domain-containing protein n=1 Tax=Ferrigenium sp. UT5 TaxID=3242105 RepID=UPI00354E823D
MRLLVLCIACLLTPLAQAAEQPQIPPSVSGDATDQPAVTISREAGQTVEEYRANGKLYMIKITPKHGVPYYLVDDLGDGKFSRHEGLDSGLRVPRWTLFSF